MHIVCKDEFGHPLTQLTQWDQNITLCIYGLGLSEKPEVHFANRNSETAFRLTGDLVTLDTDEDMVSTSIPNDLLWEDKQILVYVVTNEAISIEEVTEQRIQTIHIAQIPVRRRTKPADFYLESNVQGVDIVALKVEVKQNIMDTGLLKTDLTATKKRVTDLENNVELLRKADSGLSEQLGTISGQIEELEREDERIYERIGQGEKALENADEAIAKRVTELEANDKLLRQDIGTNTTNITNLSNTVTNTIGRVSSLEKQDDAFRKDILNLNEQVETNYGLISELDTIVWDLKPVVNNHSTDISALFSSVSDLKTKDRELATAITTAESNANKYTDTALSLYVKKDEIGDIDIDMEEITASDVDAMFA